MTHDTRALEFAANGPAGLAAAARTRAAAAVPGYALAVAAGVALGVLVGQSTWAMRGLDPLFQVLRTVPPLAWLPISLAGFQDGQPSAIFVIFITAVWPIIINTSVGIRNIPQDYRNVARVLRLNGGRVLLARSCCRPPRPTSSRACASASACRGWPSSPPRC
jgi:ABC-type nitrate/sulfonate/bicarbonate transport system permease component